MKIAVITVFFTLVFMYFCTGGAGTEATNIFHDRTVREIYTLQDKRDSNALLTYLKNGDPTYRRYAALAFASVQDKNAVNEIKDLLSDTDPGVRSAAAYALGQTGEAQAEKWLMERFSREGSGQVKTDILEALGKCGGDAALSFISDPQLIGDGAEIMKGQALGIYRFILRNKHTAEGLKTVVKSLMKSGSGEVRFYASNVLSRIREADLSEYYKDIRDLISVEKEIRTRMNLILALGKCRGTDAVTLLKTFLKGDLDEKIAVNTIRALGKFNYDQVKDTLYHFSTDRNYHISVAATEVLMEISPGGHSSLYFELGRKAAHWRAGSNLLRIALRHSDEKDRLSSLIREYYENAVDPYEKGSLLMALGEDLANYPFIEGEVFSTDQKPVSTSGMIALSAMMSLKEFEPGKIISSGKGSHSLLSVFSDIFKRGLLSGDSSLISISASALRDPEFRFPDVLDDVAFLEELLKKLPRPGDAGIRSEIQRTLDYFRGSEKKEGIQPAKKPIDWARVLSIPPDQKVKIVTGEGDIVIQLFVNDSPGSVSNFIDLIKNGYLNTGAFHRVVPNFVVQDGCPRGDGWGGPDETIRSEFSRRYYREGSLGMASSGKDTEGSQWFITHSATPHLDGRYTIFGQVVEGKRLINRLRVGSAILQYKIL